MSDGEDPFEDLGEVADRDGDPFERLDAGANEDDGDRGKRASPPDGEPGDGDRTQESALDAGTGSRTPDPETGWFEGTIADDPFPETDERGDPFEGGESVFERMDVEGIDADAVWEQLGEVQERGSVADVEGDTYAEVSKHSFCERCQHFSDPPEASCSHEGAEILAFLDMETVRVVNCPVVAQRRDLEEPE